MWLQTEARSAKAALLHEIPARMNTILDSQFVSLNDLLLLTPPSILAEQLTLIDFEIFKTIEVHFLPIILI